MTDHAYRGTPYCVKQCRHAILLGMELTMRETVSRRVHALRTDRGWSQAQVVARCARAGADWLSAYVYGQIERGTRQTVGVSDVLALALAFGVPPADLLADGDSIQVTDMVTVTPAQMRSWLAGEALPAA